MCIFGLNLVRGGRLLSLPLGSAVKTFVPPLMVAIAMCAGIIVVDMQFPHIEGWLALYKIPLGAFIYIGGYWLFFRERCMELIHVFKRLAGRS